MGEAKLSAEEVDFVSLYRTMLPSVLGYLHLRTGGDNELAHDLAAETFSAAVPLFVAGDQAQVTRSWLFTVARRRLVDHWRKKSTASRKWHLVAAEPQLETIEENLVERDLVVEALGRLNPDYRLALTLQHLDGYSIREVAAILDRTEKATESLLGRAKEAFQRNYVEIEGGQDGRH